MLQLVGERGEREVELTGIVGSQQGCIGIVPQRGDDTPGGVGFVRCELGYMIAPKRSRKELYLSLKRERPPHAQSSFRPRRYPNGGINGREQRADEVPLAAGEMHVGSAAMLCHPASVLKPPLGNEAHRFVSRLASA
jgi:hypothetical protein